jgi:serine acetyltransferase
MHIRRQLYLLIRDLEFYCCEYPPHNPRLPFCRWFVSKAFAGILCSRDFRLNLLVRVSLASIPLLSRIANSLIFYLYGSTISSNAKLDCRLRFCHARAIVIGPRVVMEGEFAYIFNNVTIGKLIPGAPKSQHDMPHFKKSVVFGVGSSVLGPLVCNHHAVFSSNSFCSKLAMEQDATIWGYNNSKEGVFFMRPNPNGSPFYFTPPKWTKSQSSRTVH